MTSERRSPILLVGALCLAGVVAMLAVNQQGSGMLYVAPSAVSSQTTVVPTVLAGSMPLMGSVDPVFVEPVQQEIAEPVEFQMTSQGQANSWSSLLTGLIAIPLAAAGFFMFKGRPTNEEEKVLISIDDLVTVGKQTLVAGAVVGAAATMADGASAYPIFAQQGFANPREATGRIVCANCHLASKETELELPQAVLPDQVFEAVTKVPYTGSPAVSQTLTDPRSLLAQEAPVSGSVVYRQGQPVDFVQETGAPISQMMLEMDVPTTANTVFKATIKVPYDESLKQPGAKGKPADLNVGAVLVLPEGFTLAPADRIPEEMKEEVKGLQWIKYSSSQPNILVVGPVPGKKYADEMVVPLLSPDPATNKNAHYGTLPVYVGGNRGRGQLYPDGSKSNNNAYNVEHAGKIADIELNEKTRVYTIAISEPNGLITNEELPAGAELIVKKGDVVEAGQVITTNPNVGGFGQTEGEIVLQDPGRVKALLFFLFAVLGTQTALVIKKKQYEQVQLSEMNF